MKKYRSVADLKDCSCPYCGRFYFMPEEELMAMRYARRKSVSSTSSTYADNLKISTAKKEQP